MNEQLLYNIADYTVVIETPCAKTTYNILPNFKPFFVEGQVRDDGVGDELFHIVGEQEISISNTNMLDDFEWNDVNYKVYSTTDNEFIIGMRSDGQTHWLQASSDWRHLKSTVSFVDTKAHQFINNFLVVAFGMSSAPFQTLKVHASVTELHGEALLFMGVSGTGKSTHSQLWREFVPGCSLLNDDEPVVRLINNNEVWVYGTPWSGKTPCYRNAKARVTAFVHLYQCPENKMRQMTNMEALASLFSSCCMMRSNSENKNQVLDSVVDILEHVPVYRLDCRPDKEAVSLTKALLRHADKN